MTRRIRIATYNVNSIRMRLGIVLDWLAKNKADILCMQETKTEDSKFPVMEFEEAGYHAIFNGQKGFNGVAIVSREKPTDVIKGLPDRHEPDQARLVAVKIMGINIINTYVPQGREMDTPYFNYKLEWLARLGKFFDEHYSPRKKLIWCGDLNIAPEDIDVHDPKGLKGHVCFNEATTRIFHDFLEWGFVDILRRHKPQGGLYTYFDFRIKGTVERNVGWRVDHILATKPLAKKSVDSYIDMKPRLGEKPSDHTPLVAEFEI